MTEQEAIILHIEECKKRIDTIQNYMEGNRNADVLRCERSIFILENVIKALEKQIAKKPVTYEHSNTADCPVCGNRVRGIKLPFGDWCSKCGQKLKWRKEDAE